jgi:hypothetical protein
MIVHGLEGLEGGYICHAQIQRFIMTDNELDDLMASLLSATL